MKTIRIQVTGCQLRPDGGLNILTKPSAENPVKPREGQKDAVHVMNPAQAARLAVRALGFNDLFTLKHGIDISNGSCTMTIEEEVIKAGDTYTDRITGEVKTYQGSRKPGQEGQPWTKHSNQELILGVAAKNKLFELTASAGIAAAKANQSQPAQRVAANQPLGIKGDEPANDAPATIDEPKV